MHQVPGNTVITLPFENNHCSAWVRLYKRWTFFRSSLSWFCFIWPAGHLLLELCHLHFYIISWCALSSHILAVPRETSLSPSCTLSFYPWTTTLLSLHPPLDTPNHFRGMNSVYKPMTANSVLTLTLSPEFPSTLPTCQLHMFQFRMVLCITCNCILWDSFSSTYLSTVTQACCIEVSEAQESSCLKHTLLPFLWP